MKYSQFFLSNFFILACIYVCYLTGKAPEDTQKYLYAVAIALFIFGLALAGMSVWTGISDQHRQNLEARYRTSDVRFLEEIKETDREVKQLVKLHLNATLHVYPWAQGWVTIIGYSGVPKGFAAEFLAYSDNTNLASINNWSDKSLWVEPGNSYDFGETRVLAHKLTEYLLDIGAAKRSFGNLPPRWVSNVSPSLMRAAWGINISMRNDDMNTVSQNVELQAEEASV